jgi:hypothetical protein
MTDKELLKTFRLGKHKVEDKSTGKKYVAEGMLRKKTGMIQRVIIGSILLPPILFFTSNQNFATRFTLCGILYLFSIFDVFLIGRFVIKEEDLKEVKEESE